MVSVYAALRKSDFSQIDLGFIRLLNNNQASLTFDGIATLEAFIECGYKGAPGKLQIHGNTLRQRIQRIKDLLKLDIEEPVVTYTLINQIKLWKLSRNEQAIHHGTMNER